MLVDSNFLLVNGDFTHMKSQAYLSILIFGFSKTK